MLTILERIRRPATTAADLRSRRAEIESELPAAERAVRAAEAQRAAGLLDLDDKHLVGIEADLAKAVRDRDRLLAARAELDRRAADAESREKAEALDADLKAVAAKADRIAASLRSDYEKAAGSLCALLAGLAEAEAEVSRVNRLLHENGRGAEAIPAIEPRVYPAGRNLPDYVSIVTTTSVRPSGRVAGWGEARRLAADLALEV